MMCVPYVSASSDRLLIGNSGSISLRLPMIGRPEGPGMSADMTEKLCVWRERVIVCVCVRVCVGV